MNAGARWRPRGYRHVLSAAVGEDGAEALAALDEDRLPRAHLDRLRAVYAMQQLHAALEDAHPYAHRGWSARVRATASGSRVARNVRTLVVVQREPWLGAGIGDLHKRDGNAVILCGNVAGELVDGETFVVDNTGGGADDARHIL